MRKVLILSGIAMLCLFSQINDSSASTAAKKVSINHSKRHKGKVIMDLASGMYYNSNAFPITVLFWQFGHPATEFTIPTGYSSGSYSVLVGTYDVEFSGSGPALYMVAGHGSMQGSDVTFDNVAFGDAVTFTCDLPE